MYAYVLDVDTYIATAWAGVWDDGLIWDDSTDWLDDGTQIRTLHVSSHSFVTKPSDTPANTLYDGRISDAGSLARSILSGNGPLGRSSVSYGFIELANAGGLDPWLAYSFDGRAFTLKEISAKGKPVSTAQTIFRGTLAGVESSDARKNLRLKIRDRLSELSVPLLTERYAGTTVSGVVSADPTMSDLAEGDTDIKDQLKPRVYGRVTNLPAVWGNKFNLLVQFSATPVESITVYDGGVPLDYHGDYPVISSLINVTLDPGEYATCLNQGIARLGGTPALGVTADVIEGVNSSDRTVGQIALRLLGDMGIDDDDIDLESFFDLDAFNDAEVGVYVTGETSTLDIIGQVLESIGAAIVPTTQGQFQVIGLSAPLASQVSGEITIRDIVDGATFAFGVGGEQEGVPVWSVALNYGRNYSPMSDGQIAGVVSLTDRLRLSTATMQEVAKDQTIKTAHPLSQQLTVDSLLSSQTDAQAEAARRLALYGVRRDRFILPVAYDKGKYELGDVVSVKLPRFGYRAGRPMMVVGRTDDFTKRLITLTVWG